jgi:hypothetical protein
MNLTTRADDLPGTEKRPQKFTKALETIPPGPSGHSFFGSTIRVHAVMRGRAETRQELGRGIRQRRCDSELLERVDVERRNWDEDSHSEEAEVMTAER